MVDYNDKDYHAVISRLETRLNNIDTNIATINATTANIQNTLSNKINEVDKRVIVLENFKYWLLGVTAASGLLFQLFIHKIKTFLSS